MTSDERWRELKRRFNAALDLPPAARRAFAAASFPDDAVLQRELEELVVNAIEDDGFLAERPGSRWTAACDDQQSSVMTIDRYELVERLAEGGMGVVYRARRSDRAFEKDVAVKVVHPHLATPAMFARFDRERQTLASLDHPCITRLLDGGWTSTGLPYLVMELVEGEPITAYCRSRDLSIADRVELFLPVCDAVHHAHRHLVIHRDLKPSNILITRSGQVKLLDFGIARILRDVHDSDDSAARTTTRDMPMTPGYASPEQILRHPITTASDIYGLGLVLYELVCGAPAFDVDGRPRYDAERMICEEQPVPPSTRARPHERRQIRGDLDSIVLTALRHEPEQRYSSAEALSDDLCRVLRREPVRARRQTLAYRCNRLVRRHVPQTIGLALALIGMVAAITGGAVSLAQVRESNTMLALQRAEAEAARDDAQQALQFMQQMLTRSHPLRRGGPTTLGDLLDDAECRLTSHAQRHPGAEPAIRMMLAESYANLMDWPPVERHATQVLAMLRRDEQASPEVLADCMALLGRARTHLSRPDAVDLQREALALRRALYGPDDARVAESIGLLGFAIWRADAAHRDFETAEAHYQECLRRLTALGLADSPQAARFTMSLGFMYNQAGRVADAERLYKRALVVYATLPVKQDMYELVTMNCYADLLESVGRGQEAAAWRQRCAHRMRDVVGG